MAHAVLVLQGPLASRGFTGATGARAFAEGPAGTLSADELIKDFDASLSIRQMMDAHGDAFDHVVVSTWEGRELAPDIEPSRVIYLEDTTQESAQYQSTKRKLNLPMNKFRQVTSALAGVEAAINLAGEEALVVLARSDITFDAGALKAFALERDIETRVIVPFISRADLCVHDFFFCGKARVLADFLHRMKADDFSECVASPHFDFILKPLWTGMIGDLDLPEAAFFPISLQKGEMPAPTAEALVVAHTRVFHPAPEALYANVIWRGDALISSEQERQFWICAEAYEAMGKKGLAQHIRSFTGPGWVEPINVNSVFLRRAQAAREGRPPAEGGLSRSACWLRRAALAGMRRSGLLGDRSGEAA